MEHSVAPSLHNGHISTLSKWMLGIAGVGLVASLAPYVLPMVGVGDSLIAEDLATNLVHQHNGSVGSGLAGIITGGLSHVPGIGASLAAGGWTAIIASGGIGIGGVLLAKWMEKREDSNATGVRWSKIVRNVALVTSALIALPSLLTGITVGLSFLAMTLLPSISSSVIGALSSTLGIAGTHTAAGGAVAATLPHLLLCGAAALPFVGALFANRHFSNEPPATYVSQTQHVSTVGQRQTLAHGY